MNNSVFYSTFLSRYLSKRAVIFKPVNKFTFPAVERCLFLWLTWSCLLLTKLCSAISVSICIYSQMVYLTFVSRQIWVIGINVLLMYVVNTNLLLRSIEIIFNKTLNSCVNLKDLWLNSLSDSTFYHLQYVSKYQNEGIYYRNLLSGSDCGAQRRVL